ncbi:MAG: maleylpyruvate isomerase family mycothiol-dependent enzyme, partial [Actinomycetota bacterium]
LGRFEELVRSLDDRAWQQPTRCEGWTAADVAAHVTGTLAEVVNFRLDGLGSPETIQRLVDERRGRSQHEMADELHEVAKLVGDIGAGITDEMWDGDAGGDLGVKMGEGVEGLWYDAWVHGHDIRTATGLAEERGPGLRASVWHLADLLAKDGWGPATLTLDGLEEVPVAGGGGQPVSGDPVDFVLVATGRQDPKTIGLDETVNVYRAT